MVNIFLGKLRWVHCPGHAGVKGNDWADRLVGKATITSGLHLEWSEVLRSLRHYLHAQSQGCHIINHLEERGMERESAWQPLNEGERAINNQNTEVFQRQPWGNFGGAVCPMLVHCLPSTHDPTFAAHWTVTVAEDTVCPGSCCPMMSWPSLPSELWQQQRQVFCESLLQGQCPSCESLP